MYDFYLNTSSDFGGGSKFLNHPTSDSTLPTFVLMSKTKAFDDLGLDPRLVRALSRRGFVQPTAVQVCLTFSSHVPGHLVPCLGTRGEFIHTHRLHGTGGDRPWVEPALLTDLYFLIDGMCVITHLLYCYPIFLRRRRPSPTPWRVRTSSPPPGLEQGRR